MIQSYELTTPMPSYLFSIFASTMEAKTKIGNIASLICEYEQAKQYEDILFGLVDDIIDAAEAYMGNETFPLVSLPLAPTQS